MKPWPNAWSAWTTPARTCCGRTPGSRGSRGSSREALGDRVRQRCRCGGAAGSQPERGPESDRGRNRSWRPWCQSRGGCHGFARQRLRAVPGSAVYDNTHLWGQAAPFDTGSHAWQTRQVVVVPEKPVRVVTVNLLLRRHGGKAWFRDAALRVLATPAGATRFDSVAVVPRAAAAAGFQVRDVAADSDYVPDRHAGAGPEVGLPAQARPGSDLLRCDVDRSVGKRPRGDAGLRVARSRRPA